MKKARAGVFSSEEFDAIFQKLEATRQFLDDTIARLKASEQAVECISRAEHVMGAIKRLEWELTGIRTGNFPSSAAEVILPEAAEETKSP